MPLKATRRNAIAHLEFLGALGLQRLNLDGFIHICYVATRNFAGTIIIASIYAVWVKTETAILFLGIWHSFVELKTVPKYAVLAPNFREGNPSNF